MKNGKQAILHHIRLKDKKSISWSWTKSLGTLKTFASMITDQSILHF